MSWTKETSTAGGRARQLKALPSFFKKNSTASNRQLFACLLLFKGRENRCEVCGLSSWMGVTIQLQLHHLDGDHRNNEESNLQILCPNCHSQTETFCGRNKNSGVKIVEDSDLIAAYLEEGNVRKALMKVNLSPRGGNYERVYKLLEREGIEIRPRKQ